MPTYTLTADFLPPGARVLSFEGIEAIHRPYRFRVVFAVPATDGQELDLDAATGSRASLNIEGPDACLLYTSRCV